MNPALRYLRAAVLGVSSVVFVAAMHTASTWQRYAVVVVLFFLTFAGVDRGPE